MKASIVMPSIDNTETYSKSAAWNKETVGISCHAHTAKC